MENQNNLSERELEMIVYNISFTITTIISNALSFEI
jgi:hypothetical protein